MGGIKWDIVSMERNEKEDSVKIQVDYRGKSTEYLLLWAHNDVCAVSSLTYFSIFTSVDFLFPSVMCTSTYKYDG